MNPGRLLFGTVLVALGLVLFGDALDWWVSGDLISTWWPLVLIAIAATAATTQPRHLLGPAILASVGVLLLADRLTVLHVASDVFWPIVVVAIGVMVMLGRPRPQVDRSTLDRDHVPAPGDDDLEYGASSPGTSAHPTASSR